MGSIVVERKASNGLEWHLWRFYVTADYGSGETIYLVLDVYNRHIRQTKRHGWQKVDSYYRLDSRGCTIKFAEAVPLPEDVVTEAKNRINAVVTLYYPR